MSLAERAANAMRPVIVTAELVYFLLRCLLSASVAISIGLALYHWPQFSQLAGSAAFAIGVAIAGFVIASPFSFASRRFDFNRWWVELLRAGLLVAFLVATCTLRLFLERFDLRSNIAQELLALLRLKFLIVRPGLWRVPLSLLPGAVLVTAVAAFLERPEGHTFDGPNPDEKVIRGPKRVLYPAVDQRHRLRYGHLPCISWCLVPLPIELARLGLRLTGSTGSGKTILLTALLRSWTTLQRSDGLYRAYILDITNDYRVIVEELLKGSGVKTYFLHPTDKHSCCWDVAAVLTRRTTRAFVQCLFRFPPGSRQDAFWVGAMHLVAQAVANGMLQRFGRNWTLADYLEWMKSPEAAREAASWDGGSVANQQAMKLFEEESDERLRDNLFATLAERCGDFHNIAQTMRLQYERGQRYSQEDSENAAVVFGWDVDLDDELKSLHAAFFALEVRAALKRHNAKGQLYLLDEAASAGPIGAAGLARLCREGRHTNCVPVLAYHSWHALVLEMGDEEAAAATAEQQFVASLTCSDFTTADHISEAFGEVEIERTVTSTTTNPPDGHSGARESTTKNTLRETKRLISAAQIQHLPLIDPTGERGPTFYAKDDQRNVYGAELPMAEVRRSLPRLPAFIAKPFDEAELERAPAVATPARATTTKPSGKETLRKKVAAKNGAKSLRVDSTKRPLRDRLKGLKGM